MKKVRITKEQLESIVESTLNVENTEVVSEEIINEDATFLDPMLLDTISQAIQNMDWSYLQHLYNSFESIKAVVGGLSAIGLLTGGIAYIKKSMNDYYRANPEEAKKLEGNKEEIIQKLKQ